MDYVIFTDTSANLPDKVVREYGLRQIPFFYCPPEHPEGIPCPGSEEFDGSAYYNAIRRGAVVTTSQINVHQYVNAMDPVLEAGHDILFVGMSSGISGAYHSATQAAHILSEQYPERRIRTVDTLSASLGEGLLVIEAAKMRDAGVELDEVADRLNSLRMRMGQIFTVDDLFCLKRGGRLSGAAALLGTALGIKPILCSNAQGQILSCAKVRGRRASIQALADRYDQLVEKPEQQCIGIAHCDCYPDVQTLITLLNRNHPPREIMTVMYEPVTGAHVGPGALALFFFGNPASRELAKS